MPTKIHRILAEACVQTLEQIFDGGMVADRAVARTLSSHQKWGARDRAFVAETIYEVVRWRRRLEWLAGAGDWQPLAGMHWAQQGCARPEWAAWPEIPPDLLAERLRTLEAAPRAIRESVADEFDTLAAAGLKQCWDREITALNQPAPVFLRVNPLRSSLTKVASELAEHRITAVPVEGAALALRIEDGRTVPSRLRQSGRFEIQDAASQQVAPFLDVEPGQRVVDACAGAGGKTLHLAALMKGEGELRALDVDETRLQKLRERAGAAGAKVRAVVITPEILNTIDHWADRVLIDAPCSGSGTLRRQPELKYRITAASLAAKCAVQRELLLKFAAPVRPGGKLVYATCSVLPCENEDQAAWFSEQRPDFVREDERRISPAESGWDGFYMARWRKE